MVKLFTLVASFAAALGVVGTAAAEDAATDAQAKAAIPYRDATAPAQEFSADPSQVTMEQRADGTVVYDLHGQGMQAITATRDANGKIHYQCNDAADHAAHAAEVANEK